MILIPRYREIELPIALNRPRFTGHFILEAVGLDGRKRKLAEFDNLVTTNGANLLGGGGGSPLQYCLVGSGNTAPALTDTALQTFVASTQTINSSTQGNSGSSPYFGTRTIQYNFAVGAATGNLSEVGIGPVSTNSNLFSRALILDGVGSPTTITVLSSEALYVTYQLNQYVPLTDVSNNIIISGTTYAYVLRASLATSASSWGYVNADVPGIGQAKIFNGAIGAITSSPAGTQAVSDSNANNAYSTGSFSLSGTSTWGLTTGNLSGGITAAQILFGTSQQSRGAYQVSFSPAIPKDASHILTLSFSTSWVINSP